MHTSETIFHHFRYKRNHSQVYNSKYYFISRHTMVCLKYPGIYWSVQKYKTENLQYESEKLNSPISAMYGLINYTKLSSLRGGLDVKGLDGCSFFSIDFAFSINSSIISFLYSSSFCSMSFLAISGRTSSLVLASPHAAAGAVSVPFSSSVPLSTGG